MLFDVHSHLVQTDNNQEIHICNLIVTDSQSAIPDCGYFSAGIHPWYISEDIDAAFENLRNITTNERCLAIGECGLDRLKGPGLAVQEAIFRQQLLLAESLNKPVIIHSVRCFPELIRMKKELAIHIPCILHNFSGNQQQLQELIRHGFCFSVGIAALPHLIRNKSLSQIPLNLFFIETDESLESLSFLYQKIAFERQIAISELESLISTNFHNIFLRNSIL